MPGMMRQTVSKVCESQVACDGAYVVRRSQPEATVCAKCEKALALRGKEIKPRGINFRDRTDKKYGGEF